MTGILRREAVRLNEEERLRTLEALRAFLRTEAFAAHTYDAALARAAEPDLRRVLVSLRNSHAGRACLLAERTAEFGGDPRDVPNPDAPWGAFANAHRRVIAAVALPDVLDALREGERFCTSDYIADLSELDAALRCELARIMLPEQHRTAAVLGDLCVAFEALPTPSLDDVRSRRIA